MQIDAIDWFKFIYLTSLYLIIISTQIIVIADTTEPVTSIPNRQMCSKIQSMLSYGKYQTYQISSNITYVSRVYAQNFLAYSSLEDILILIEPKHQLHVYNAQTIRLIISITTTNVVYATSCISLTTNDRHDLFFVYETRLQPNILSIRVCQVQFDTLNLNFQEKQCIETLNIRCDIPDIRINGFTIKRDHVGTKKSLLFISTDIGLIYTIFDTNTGSLVREPIVLNDTLNEGSVVVTSSGIIYYANKQEHTIHEIHVTRDFRIRYGKIIKSNAIKSPFGLITDECNHLYISTKSMILVMFIQTYTTIRSVFSKASDLPITIERLNSTTYVYATVKKYSGRIPAVWMFNFLSFSDTEKTTVTTRIPTIKMEKKLNTTTITTSLPISESLAYTHFTSTPATSEQTSTDHTTLYSLSTEHLTSISSDEVHNNSSDDNVRSLSNENHVTTQSSSSLNTFSEYMTSTINSLETFESSTQNVTSATLSTTQNVILNDIYTSVETVSEDYTTSIGDTTSSLSSITQQTSEETSTFSSSLSTKDSTEYLHSSILTSTSLETTRITSPFDVTQSSILSSERTTNVDSTLSSSEPSTIEEQSTVTELNTIHYSDQSVSNLDTTESTQLPSTILTETLSTDLESTSMDTTLTTTSEYLSDSSIPHSSTSFDQSTSQINDVITSTIPFETTSLQDQFHSSTIESSTDNVTDDLYTQSQMITDSSIHSIQTTTLFMTTTDFFEKETEDGIIQKHVSPMLVEVNVSSTPYPSSPFEVSSTVFTPSLSSQSPSSTHPSLAHSSTTSTKLNRLLSSKYFSVATTTISDPTTTLSSSISTIQTTDSVTTSDTTEQSVMTTFSDESSSSPWTTSYPNDTPTSTYTISSEPSTIDYSTKSLTTLYPDETSSSTYTISSEPSTTDYTTMLLTTSYSDETSSSTYEISSEPSTTDYATMPLTTSYPDVTSPFTYEISSESSTTDYATFSTMIVTTTVLDSTTSTQTDESSTLLILTTGNQETLAITDSRPFETTPVTSTTTEYPNEYTSTQPSLEIASTTLPNIYDFTTAQPTLVVTLPKPRSSRLTRRTSKSTTSSTTTSTIRTINPYRTRKQKTTRLKSESSTTTTSTTITQTTSTYTESLTSSPIVIWYSKPNSRHQQQMVVIKPTINTTSSNTLLSNELLNSLFNSTTNSTQKLIFFNLVDLPPASWNLSLNTNESVLLDIVLPPISPPLTPNSTTNLTFTNVEANLFATNIVGSPINLQVNQIQAKQFSLAMNLTNNLTNNQLNQSSSDVVIGRIRSEQFELNITKSDKINVHVQQVDSETAELYFDSKFCTNETNLQINLNLSKNGTIRYGDRPPLRIGPVFTRVHMLKQSCDLEQPFTLFFDICEGRNPCLNGGTCKSQIPDYNNPSYSQQESSQINYRCICPARISGEHCEQLEYPFGYCINGGNLTTKFDEFNRSIEQCSCAKGFQGSHCEDNINDCINIDCSNHGVCRDGINTYSCSCFDGFYGDQCEQKNVETVLLQVASKSFATVAILLIAGIAGLVVASDIHTYLTRKRQKPSHQLSKLPRATSELFENSVLLLGFGDAPIEMSDLSTIDRERKISTMKQRPKDLRKQSGYKRISERRYTYAKTLEKPSSKRSLLSNPAYKTIL